MHIEKKKFLEQECYKRDQIENKKLEFKGEKRKRYEKENIFMDPNKAVIDAARSWKKFWNA